MKPSAAGVPAFAREQHAYFSPDIETMPRRQLQRLQFERLRRMLHHAYTRVPHYCRSFGTAGVTPFSVRSLGDFRQIPLLSPEDLVDAGSFGLVAVPRETIVRLHETSGPAARPAFAAHTGTDLANQAQLMARSMFCAGARAGDIIHSADGDRLPADGLAIHDGAQRLGCTLVPAGGGVERQIALLADIGAGVLCTTPAFALDIALSAQRLGAPFPREALRIGLFSTRFWTEALRRELQRRLGLKAMAVYGPAAIMGPGVAVECHEAQAGLHGWEDHFLFEIVDPATKLPLPMGDAGELVVTTLAREALPLIRYRTGDIATLTDEPCRCGRTHVRIRLQSTRDDGPRIVEG